MFLKNGIYSSQDAYYKTLLLFVLFAVAMAISPSPILSGVWEGNPKKIYSIDMSSFECYKLTEQDNGQISSLIENLKSKGVTIYHYYVFVKTTANLNINSKPMESVYANINNKKEFLIDTKNNTFIVESLRVLICGWRTKHIYSQNNYKVAVDVWGNGLQSFGELDVTTAKFNNKTVVTWY